MENGVNREARDPVDGGSRQRVGRRAVLGLGVGTAAASLLPLLSGSGQASSGSDASTTTTPTITPPTTAAPPRRPSSNDIGLLGDAQRMELTARALYDAAIAAGGWSDTETTVITTLREAHEAAAQALSGLLGRDAPGEMSSTLYRAWLAQFEGSPSARLEAAYHLEAAMVATHHDVLGKLIGTDGATLIAAIQSAEARHGTVIADLDGLTDLASLLVHGDAAVLEVTA